MNESCGGGHATKRNQQRVPKPFGPRLTHKHRQDMMPKRGLGRDLMSIAGGHGKV